MSYSAMVDKLMPAYEGNYTAGRQVAVKEITIHHTASVMSLDALGRLWQTKGRKGSSHYGVKDNSVYCYVSEGDTAWTNGNWPSNQRAITIETVNSEAGGDWPVSEASLDTLIKLVADIAKRKGLGPLKVGENLTYHSMYAATACPGNYLRSRMQYIADRANAINSQVGCDECNSLQGEVDKLKKDIDLLTEEATEAKIEAAKLKEENRKLNSILDDIEKLVEERQ